MLTNRYLPTIVFGAALTMTIGCGGSPTSPSGPPAGPAPSAPSPAPTYTVTGKVIKGADFVFVGATVTIIDGPNAGMTTTTGPDGKYGFSGLKFAGFSVAASAPGYVTVSRGIRLTEGVYESTGADLTLLPEGIWSVSGHGSTTTGEMPRWVTRVRITGEYRGRLSGLTLFVGSKLIVMVQLGTDVGRFTYDMEHDVTPSEIRVISQPDLAWSVQELR